MLNIALPPRRRGEIKHHRTPKWSSSQLIHVRTSIEPTFVAPTAATAIKPCDHLPSSTTWTLPDEKGQRAFQYTSFDAANMNDFGLSLPEVLHLPETQITHRITSKTCKHCARIGQAHTLAWIQPEGHSITASQNPNGTAELLELYVQPTETRVILYTETEQKKMQTRQKTHPFVGNVEVFNGPHSALIHRIQAAWHTTRQLH